ncbi:MAG: NlpC/P60 family protein [Coriobacteriia bacterium]|nr:NlpC/P60 family protein [Coriobacteriia bacterium]
MHDKESNKDNATRLQFSRRTFAGGLVAAVIAGTFNPFISTAAHAEPTSAEKQAEADEVTRKLEAWGQELDEATTTYYLAIEAHDNAIEAMEGAEARILAAEEEITRLQSRLGARATSMYKQGQYSFLEVFFGARSFAEFTTTWDLLNMVTNEDATLIEQSKAAKLDAQAARDDFATQERFAAQKLAEAEEIRERAEQIVAEGEALLASLEAEVAELLQKEKEEEERRQREAAAEAARLAALASMNSGGGGGGWGDGIPVFTGGVTDIICQAAESRLGCPYVWAATGPNTFDCSGLTQWCYRQAGISIPRVDTSQRAAATSVLPVSQAEPGDIMWKYGHVGIYMGGGAYIHAPYTGDVVRYAWNMDTWTNACRY